MYPADPNSDDRLAERLRDVSLPPGLLERLRSIATLSEDELDAALRDVPVPVGLVNRLQRTARPRLSLAKLTDMATAAALLISIGLSYLGVVAACLWAMYPATGNRAPGLAAIEFVAQMDRGPDVTILVSTVPNSGSGDVDADPRLAADPTVGLPKISLAMQDEATQTSERSWIGPFYPTSTGPSADPMLDATLGLWGSRKVYGSHNAFDELPELKKVPGPIPRGIAPPPAPGFDLGILIRYHVHPFVSPAAHPDLRGGVVPLAIDTSSYELTRRYLEDGELPLPDAVRTEQFLAALDYEFPRPEKRALRLSVAGGPSVFRGRDLQLLQIGVQARQMSIGPRAPTHLTLAVDVSSSMRWGGRLEMVRRAIGKLVDNFGEEDRLDLVAFNERADVLIEDVKSDEKDQLLAAVKTLSAQGSTNLGAGLRSAYAVAQRGMSDGTAKHCVVLLSDGRSELDRGTADRIEKRLADAARRGLSLHVIDLGQDGDPSQFDPLLASFAKAGGGRIAHATGVDQIGWSLLEVITGRRQLVAADARLKVTFNPKTVRAYRLLGHEARLTGLNPADPQADFLSGQAAGAMYEVSLKPGGGSEVAVAELSWRDPSSGKTDRLARKINRGSFAPSLLEAPLSLQAAAVAAETAEILRESPYVQTTPKPAAFARVVEVARQLDSRLYDRPTFTELLSLAERAEKARPYRGGGRR